MMRDKIFLLATLFGVALSMVSCKPTENNYRAAYDAAQGKRHSVDTDADILNSGKLEEPQPESDKPKQFKVETRRSNNVENDDVYLFVIARYGMSTNAEAHSAALRDKGFDAQAVSFGDDEWYVAAGSFPEEEPAQEFGRKYEASHPRETRIGLSAPFILRLHGK